MSNHPCQKIEQFCCRAYCCFFIGVCVCVWPLLGVSWLRIFSFQPSVISWEAVSLRDDGKKCIVVAYCCFRREDVSILSSLLASNLRRPFRHDTTSFLVSKLFLMYITAVLAAAVRQAVCLAAQVHCQADDMRRPVCHQRQTVSFWMPLTMTWMLTVCHPARRHRWQHQRRRTASLTWKRTVLTQQYRRPRPALRPVSLACSFFLCSVGCCDVIQGVYNSWKYWKSVGIQLMLLEKFISSSLSFVHSGAQ